MFEDDRDVLYEDVGVHSHLVDVRCVFLEAQSSPSVVGRMTLCDIGVFAQVGEPNQNMARQ